MNTLKIMKNFACGVFFCYSIEIEKCNEACCDDGSLCEASVWIIFWVEQIFPQTSSLNSASHLILKLSTVNDLNCMYWGVLDSDVQYSE